ncbi:hypothetical protein ACOMHN_064240 [Nucella lapillus]
MVELGSNGSACLLTLRPQHHCRPNYHRVYAPKLSATTDVTDEFYENLAASIRNIPSTEQSVLNGDFNTRVGAGHESWRASLKSVLLTRT